MVAPDVAALLRDASTGGRISDAKSIELAIALLVLSDAPFSREQFAPGHITCTGAVIHPDGERVLLIRHRRLQRWLLPGGHVEKGDEQIWDAGAREVREETGVRLVERGRPLLAGVDVHGIPARGHEPYHLHHDLIWAFRAASGEIPGSTEVDGAVWCEAAEFDRYGLAGSVRQAVLVAQRVL